MALVPLLVAVGAVVLWALLAGAGWLNTGVAAWAQARRHAVDPAAVLPQRVAGAAVRALVAPDGRARVEARRDLQLPLGGGGTQVVVRAEAAAR